MPKIDNDFWKRSRGEMIFIAGKKLIPVPVEWRYQIIWVLSRILVGSTYRAGRTKWFF